MNAFSLLSNRQVLVQALQSNISDHAAYCALKDEVEERGDLTNEEKWLLLAYELHGKDAPVPNLLLFTTADWPEVARVEPCLINERLTILLSALIRRGENLRFTERVIAPGGRLLIRCFNEANEFLSFVHPADPLVGKVSSVSYDLPNLRYVRGWDNLRGERPGGIVIYDENGNCR